MTGKGRKGVYVEPPMKYNPGLRKYEPDFPIKMHHEAPRAIAAATPQQPLPPATHTATGILFVLGIVTFVMLFGWCFIIIGSIPQLSRETGLILMTLADAAVCTGIGIGAKHLYACTERKGLFWIAYVTLLAIALVLTAHALAGLTTF